MISGLSIADAVGYSMLLGGILSVLDVVASEVSVLLGPCICAGALSGNEYGWRLCSCVDCTRECGIRNCNAVALPQLAGLHISCCSMSSEHLYDVLFDCWHDSYDGASAGSFMWAANLAGLVHSSLSSSHSAALFHSFSVGFLAVNEDACYECDGPPSDKACDGSICGSEHFPFSPLLDDDDLVLHDGGPDNCAFTFDDPDPIPRIGDVLSLDPVYLSDASVVADAILDRDCSSSHSEHDGSDCDSDYFPPPPLVDDDGFSPSPPHW